MEHLRHFGLGQDPFENEPDLRAYYESCSHRSAQRRVERGVRQGKGLTLLVGAVGTGKTLLTRRILEGLEEEMFDANLLVMVMGAADSGSVLARFARQLGVEALADDRGALLAQIYEQLAVVREDGRHAVLIIDDAHVMSSGALAEVGGLLNLEYEDRRLLSLVLVGLPELEQALGRDLGLGQRVDVRVQLEALSAEDSAAYLAHRIQRVGGNPSIVSADALAALYKYGRGRPRLMNTLADNALFEAFEAGRGAMESGDVERAAADLGIGAEPGSTFVNAPPPAPTAEAGNPGASGELPSLEPDASAGDLDAFLDSAPSLSEEDEDEPEAVSQLELEDALEPAPAPPPAAPAAPPAADEEDALLAVLEPEPEIAGPDAPEKTGDDEIDDLFAELLEE